MGLYDSSWAEYSSVINQKTTSSAQTQCTKIRPKKSVKKFVKLLLFYPKISIAKNCNLTKWGTIWLKLPQCAMWMYNHRRELHNSQFENARLLFHLLMAPSFLVFGIRYRKSWSRNCRFRKIRSIPPCPPLFLPCFISFLFLESIKIIFYTQKNFKWQDNLVLTLLINYAIIIDNDISPQKSFWQFIKNIIEH